MERYIGPLVSLLVSVGLFTYGYGRLAERSKVNTDNIAKTRNLIDEHTRQTDIHIDPVRDRESRVLVAERLARVEKSMDELAVEIRTVLRAKQ